MVDTPISALTQFLAQADLLIPVVDPTKPPGQKNGYVLLSGIQGLNGVAPVVAGATATTGATLQIPDDCSVYFVRAAGTLALLTLILPQTPPAGNLTIIFQTGVTALTLQPGAGASVNNPVAGAAFVSGDRIITTYDISGSLWC